MNKKTLKILIASIAGVVVLALVAALVVIKVWHPGDKKNKDNASASSDPASSTVETVSGNDAKGTTEKDSDAKASDASGSKSGSGNTASNGESGDKNGKSNSPVSIDATICVKDTSGKKGQTIKVPVEITKNPGIMSCMLQFKYDKKSLEYLGFQKTGMYTDYKDHSVAGRINIIMLSDQDVKKDGTILYLNFKVKDTASSSTKISVSDGGVGIGNMAEQLLAPKFKNGTVTIK